MCSSACMGLWHLQVCVWRLMHVWMKLSILRSLLYADDIVLFFRPQHLDTVEKYFQNWAMAVSLSYMMPTVSARVNMAAFTFWATQKKSLFFLNLTVSEYLMVRSRQWMAGSTPSSQWSGLHPTEYPHTEVQWKTATNAPSSSNTKYLVTCCWQLSVFIYVMRKCCSPSGSPAVSWQVDDECSPWTHFSAALDTKTTELLWEESSTRWQRKEKHGCSPHQKKAALW